MMFPVPSRAHSASHYRATPCHVVPNHVLQSSHVSVTPPQSCAALSTTWSASSSYGISCKLTPHFEPFTPDSSPLTNGISELTSCKNNRSCREACAKRVLVVLRMAKMIGERCDICAAVKSTLRDNMLAYRHAYVDPIQENFQKKV